MVIEGFKEYEAIRDFLYTRMRGYHSPATTSPMETFATGARAASALADPNAEMVSLLLTIRDELQQTRKLLEAGRDLPARDSSSLGQPPDAEDV